MTLRDFSELLALFCVSLLLFTWGVGSQEIIGFESRFYLFALEMWRHGASWFPMTYHTYYADYPATSTLLIYFTANFLGGMSKLAAVIPTAIAAGVTVVFTYLIGALHSKRYGLYAVFFLMMTVLFFKSARTITLDMYSAMITTICFYIMYSADLKHEHDREWFLYPLLVLGFAFRGPIGLVVPAGVICSYYLLDRNFKHLFFSGAFALMLLMLGMWVLLLLADHVGGDHFVTAVLKMQVVGRMGHDHAPSYFYFMNSLTDYALSFPLAAIASVGAIYYEQRLHHHTRELKLLLKLFGWVMVILIGMSIPGDKKARYVLAMAPALALLSAYIFVAPKDERYFSRWQWLLLRVFLLFPIILYIGLRLILSYANNHILNFKIDYLLLTQIFFAAMALNFLIFICLEKKPKLRETGILCVAAICFAIFYIKVVDPVEQFIDRTREFVTEVEAARAHSHAKLVFYHEHPDGLPIKYLINMQYEEPSVFIQNESELMVFPDPAFFVTSQMYFDRLSPEIAQAFRIIGRDQIGHVPVVVFTQR